MKRLENTYHRVRQDAFQTTPITANSNKSVHKFVSRVSQSSALSLPGAPGTEGDPGTSKFTSLEYLLNGENQPLT